MTSTTSSLTAQLQTLDDLLVQERHAITHLRMHQLDAIQRQKIKVLKRLQETEHIVESETVHLIDSIKRNNERNRVLLASGLQVIGKLQDNIFRHLAITYAAYGRSLNIGLGSRLLNRSV